MFRNRCADRGLAFAGLMDPCSTFTETAQYFGGMAGINWSDSVWNLISDSPLTQPSRWGPKPIGANGHYLVDKFGLPALQWPDRTAGQVTLAPLYGSDGTPLTRVVVVPIHGPEHGDWQRIYIEYRYPQSLDVPIAAPFVLISRLAGWARTDTPVRAADGSPVQDLIADNVHIRVISSGGPTATVSIDTAYGLPRVPDLIGATRVDAWNTVVAAGLTGSVSSRVETSCEHFGQVVDQTPDPGTVVDPGSRVIFYIAGHRGPCQIP